MDGQDEMRVTELADNLKEWKHILLVTDRWLKWEKNEYPIIMGVSITLAFFLFWYLSPPVLSALALAAMCIAVADYIVPRLEHFGFSITDEWSDEKEAEYRKICSNIIWIMTFLQVSYQWIKLQKQQKPKMFFCGALICLLITGFIAGAIPNLFLIYLLVTFIVLMPGLHKNGYLLQWKIIFLQYFIDIAKKMRQGKLKG